MKGFIINVTNPFVWILWLSIVPNTGIFRERALVLLVILATILSRILSSFFAGKLKVLTPLVIFLY